MLSSPYPVPPLWPWTLAVGIAYAHSLVAGIWVLISPPISYDGLSAQITVAWAIMLLAGGVVALFALLRRLHKVEPVGIVLILGGLAVYLWLTWSSVLDGQLGSGGRAFIIGIPLGLLAARLIVLLYIDRRAKKLARISEAVG